MTHLAPAAGLRAVGVALLLAAAVAFCPNRAAAECGHYVTILQPSADANADRPAPIDSPCQGPLCSSHQPIPLAPLPAPVNPTPDAKAALSGYDNPGPEAPQSTESSQPRFPSTDRADPIFHPPRV
jgi:hypothetical protein